MYIKDSKQDGVPTLVEITLYMENLGDEQMILKKRKYGIISNGDRRIKRI